MLPISWNIWDSPFSGLWPLTVHAYRDKKLQYREQHLLFLFEVYRNILTWFRHQEVCNNQTRSSLLWPLTMLCWNPLRTSEFWGHESPISLLDVSLFQTPAFWFVWPHCEPGTGTCVPSSLGVNITSSKKPLLTSLANAHPTLVVLFQCLHSTSHYWNQGMCLFSWRRDSHNHLNLESWVTVGIFTMLCNHHSTSSKISSSPQKKTPSLLAFILHYPVPGSWQPLSAVCL